MQEVCEKKYLPKKNAAKENRNFAKNQTCFIIIQVAVELPPLFY